MRQKRRDTCLREIRLRRSSEGLNYSTSEIRYWFFERRRVAFEKISKINLWLFLFALAGTFSARQTMTTAKKNQLRAFSCQYLISVQSQKQPGNSSRCHCLLFSSERIEFRTIDFTILWDECVGEIFFVWFFCFHSWCNIGNESLCWANNSFLMAMNGNEWTFP